MQHQKHVAVAVLLFVLILTTACSRQEAASTSSGGGDAKTVLSKANALDRVALKTEPHTASGATAPSFVVDPGWPKTLPNKWRLGQIGGLFVDRHDHIWVYHRPRSLTTDEAGALDVAGKDPKGNPVSALGHPRPYGRHSSCCIPAPSVLQFDKEGNLLQAWGGPSDPGFLEKKCRKEDGCFWPAREHGIYVDHNDFVYVSGNGQNFTGQFPWAATFGDDSHILKFKTDGTFVLQIGNAGAEGPNSDDTNGGINGTPQPYLVADFSVDPKTNRMYIADGYGNRRILVVDAATGKYIGHWGAYGQNPVDGDAKITANVGYDSGPWMADYHSGNMKPKFFRSPLHCAQITKDGMLYACDRGNNRVQVFNIAEAGKPCANPNGDAGKCGFVGEVYIAPQTAYGTSGSANFSSDPEQSCLYVADLTNAKVYELNRKNLQELDSFGREGRQVGEFHWLHVVTVDSEGNLYTGEVDTASRVQKFLRYGPAGCSGSGSAQVGKF
ncbi:MAG: hypothetical protein AB7O65_01590 [Candidatus Korobacteraceae bacterium]